MELKEYIEKGNSQTDLGFLMDVSPSQINHWLSGIRPIPIYRCADIERATGGQVTRRDLRPDDWARIWPELANGDD